MAHKIAVSTLNASTVDILNVIRDNASLAYQNSVPTVVKATDIPKVGEVIYGTPAFANEFINALVNRIALVRVQSATFNNIYARLKKGYLDYGESVEEIFVDIARVFEFSAEKAEARELKQYKPNVRSAFHAMNWKVLYPVSVSDEQLRQAFLSAEGVQNLIAKIVDSVYRAADYDEFLLFKYMLIKSVANKNMKLRNVIGNTPADFAKAFRGLSNTLPFMSADYNAAGVKNTTPKDRQIIFMDAQFNADFDVDVLSAAFNMDKADFMGRLYLIDDWTSFDNERWSVIRENSDGIDEVTEAELEEMAGVKAVILDEEWFQVYDNLNRFAEKFVASGLRWNYFYHVWKTISCSPFANAVVITNSIDLPPQQLTFTVVSREQTDNGLNTLTLIGKGNFSDRCKFVQTTFMTQAGVAVHPYGAFMWGSAIPDNPPPAGNLPVFVEVAGNDYRTTGLLSIDANGIVTTTAAVGDEVTFTKV